MTTTEPIYSLVEQIHANNQPDQSSVQRVLINRLCCRLSTLKGHSTSLVSLYVPGKDSQLNRAKTLVTSEYGTASCIKSRVTRQSVQSALSSLSSSLKQYKRIPKNGLICFVGLVNACGSSVASDNSKVCVVFEPWFDARVFSYLCSSSFNLEPIQNDLKERVSGNSVGIIVIDGHGSLFATLQGASYTIKHRFSVQLPKKHGRGGQSSARFGRQRG
mmetsp:Transcript_3104/g.4547  ORF Transcript_3104/g.4547 Transcript_3104/m.4547 type:complete len:217 (-) Transcript_3104:911-1561(-)